MDKQTRREILDELKEYICAGEMQDTDVTIAALMEETGMGYKAIKTRMTSLVVQGMYREMRVLDPVSKVYKTVWRKVENQKGETCEEEKTEASI